MTTHPPEPQAAGSPQASPPPAQVPLFGERSLKMQTPNILTVLRLLMTVAFIATASIYRFAVSSPGLVYAAIALFVLAAATDWLDGYLARRWQAISIFGRVMDPLADKLLILTAFILLAGPAFAASITEPAIIDAGADTRDASDAAARTVQVTGVYPWMAALILARELLITSLRGVCEARGVDFSASLTGKLKMIAQSISVPLILVLVAIAASAAATGEIDTVERLALVNLIIAMLVTAVTAASAVPYLTRAYAGLTGADEPSQRH